MKRLFGNDGDYLKVNQLDNGYQFVTRKDIPVVQGNHNVDAVVVLARDKQGRLLVIREKRPVTGGYVWALPAGMVDKNETVFMAASREIREETGLYLMFRKGIDTYFLNTFSSPGLTDEKIAVVTGEVYGELSKEFQEKDEEITPYLLSADDMKQISLDDANTPMSIWLALALLQDIRMLRIIGDLHGKHDQYLHVIHNAKYSVQLGDCGFNYKVLEDEVDPDHHKFLKGNHDNHDAYPIHCLPEFGYTNFGGLDFFHVQGGFSINWKVLQLTDLIDGTKSWWENEQLSYDKLVAAYEMYKLIKPDLVLTHEAPRSIVQYFSNTGPLIKFGFDPEKFSTNTSEALQAMLEYHRPRRWFFGHYHVTRTKAIDGTVFQCLDELNYMDIGEQNE